MPFNLTFADTTYNSNAYGASTYATGSNSATTNPVSGTGLSATNTGTNTNTQTGGTQGISGSLSNTGFDILLVTSLACVLIFLALIIRFWRRPDSSLQTPSADK